MMLHTMKRTKLHNVTRCVNNVTRLKTTKEQSYEIKQKIVKKKNNFFLISTNCRQLVTIVIMNYYQLVAIFGNVFSKC